MMIHAVETASLENQRIVHFSNRLEDRIADLNTQRNYGSLPERITEYAQNLSKELSLNPSRSKYLDLHIRRNELKETNLKAATTIEEPIESSSFKLFESLFSDLDKLIQLRQDMVPTKGPKPPGTNRILLDEKRPEFDKAISSLASGIGVFLESLSNQSREFVEKYAKDHTQSVHQFMNAPLPKSHIKFRHLLGLDKNQDGSKRERIKRPAQAHLKKAQPKKPEITAKHIEENTYELQVPRFNLKIYAEKISKTYSDGSARFRPLDASTQRMISSLNNGQDYIVAFVEK